MLAGSASLLMEFYAEPNRELQALLPEEIFSWMKVDPVKGLGS